MLESYLPCCPASVPTRHVSVADVSTPAAERYARRLRSLKYTVGSMTMAAMSIHACRALPNAPPKGRNEGATALKFWPSMMRKSTALHAIPLTSETPMAHLAPDHMSVHFERQTPDKENWTVAPQVAPTVRSCKGDELPCCQGSRDVQLSVQHDADE